MKTVQNPQQQVNAVEQVLLTEEEKVEELALYLKIVGGLWLKKNLDFFANVTQSYDEHGKPDKWAILILIKELRLQNRAEMRSIRKGRNTAYYIASLEYEREIAAKKEAKLIQKLEGRYDFH